MTIPNGPDPADHDRVVWTASSDAIWWIEVQDLPIVATEEPAAPAAPSTTGPVSTPIPTSTKTAGREPFTGADTTAVCE
ncbi:hypothetical protein [Pengzhenrongella phosphoraccumulans]|uniref:hypothetical protein n=1 Tax=Pengzhenrongella phosphoraccumulans TaxID=3114394 RepID=UPI00388E4AA6